ncbi:MAG: thiol-disulfide isomerase and thioredoxin [Halothiobacillaceae bacterium]|nr:MAG: thiol-disulfide isomerase and thioredoxin [Halothiobacillaceae bacterium]
MQAKTYLAVPALVFLTWINPVSAANLRPYSESSDPKAALVAAVTEARSLGKKVLITFGSDWCPDCRAFDQQLQKEPLNALISHAFIVIKADIGHWDKNMDFANRFGNPVQNGIPAIAVIDADQKQYYVTPGGELAHIRHLSIERLTEWFALLADGAHKKSSLHH